MTRASGIYEGFVRHRRFAPVGHAFRFPMFMMYLDLDELPALFKGLWSWSASHPAPAWWRRRDYLGRDGDLAACVRKAVIDSGGRPPEGPIRMLTHLRYFGVCFNPVTFYYCFDRVGERVETIVAEITNTPWGHRHRYVLTGAQADARDLHRYRFAKTFYVSPFMPMDVGYDWSFTPPGERLFVNMNLERGGKKVFDATLLMHRTEISPASLRRTLVRYPMLSVQLIGAIYREAFALWRKKAPAYPYPAEGRGVLSTDRPDAHPKTLPEVSA